LYLRHFGNLKTINIDGTAFGVLDINKVRIPIESERLASGHKAKFLPSVTEFAYDWLKTEGYLGNVSKYNSN